MWTLWWTLAACTGGVDDTAAPPPAEQCFDAGDEDRDGAADCKDSDCLDWCGEDCDNGADDDGDGLIDCDDPTCAQACRQEHCANGDDDDRDGLTDCEDGECADWPGCGEDCFDGSDDDDDGLVDCDDDDCWGLLGCLPSGTEVESRVVAAHGLRLAERYRDYVLYGWWGTTTSFDGQDIAGTAVVRLPSSSVTCSWGQGVVHRQGSWEPVERWGFHVDSACPVQTSGFLPPSPVRIGDRVAASSSHSGGWYAGSVTRRATLHDGWTHMTYAYTVQTTTWARYLDLTTGDPWTIAVP